MPKVELGYTLIALFEITVSHLFCIIDKYNNHGVIYDLGYNVKYKLDYAEEWWSDPNENLYDINRYIIKNVWYGENWDLNSTIIMAITDIQNCTLKK